MRAVPGSVAPTGPDTAFPVRAGLIALTTLSIGATAFEPIRRPAHLIHPFE